MDALAQTALLVSLTSFSLGFATLARNVRNKLFILFAFGCTVISVWALFYFIASVWPENGWYGYHLSLNAWLAPAGLLFIQSMMRIERWFTSRFLLFLSLTCCIGMTIMVLFGLERHELIRNIIYFTPTLIMAQVLILMVFDRRLSPVVGIRHRYLLYGATVLVLMTSAMDHVHAYPVAVPIFGNFALTIYIFFLSRAITQQRLLNVRGLFARFLTLILVAVLLAGIFSLVRSWVHELKLFFLNSFIASFFLLTILEPLRTFGHFLVDRVLTRRAVFLQKEIDAAVAELSLIVNPKDSLNIFEKFAVRVLKPNGIAFYIHSSDPKILRRERSIGEGRNLARAPVEIPKHHPIFDALASPGAHADRKSQVLLDQMIEDEVERMAGQESKHRYSVWIDAIHSLGGNIIFPFRKDGRILGIAVLDVPNPPEEYGANWSILRDMEPLADRVAEMIEKSSVFDREREVERLATLGEMAAGLAHEIRNPLGAIKGAAQYLDPSSDRPDSRFLSVIIEEADRLNAVVTQFLDYAKPTATREYKEVDLNNLVQKLVMILSPTAPEDVDLRLQSSLLKARIRCAPEQIHQVLLNLIQNAFKALRRWDVSRGDVSRGQVEKSVLVSLDAFETDDLRSMIRVTIEDNGPGIPRENLEKIFIPFFTTDPSGTGLGLPICRKIIQAHGGSIEVSSVPGVTTQFRIILPEAP
jgi:two-component system sensor histidine kinase HydH